MRLLIFVLLSSFGSLNAQDRTVGIFTNDSLAYNGYTLVVPSTSRNSYLIDNCGYVINEWQSQRTPGLSAYLLEDGSLLRTGREFTNFASGGNGGHIEIRDWDNNLLWEYTYANNEYTQHHDIEPLPNGNILILAWERVATSSVIAAGRNPASIGAGGVWYEKIVEVKPLGTDDIEIVWAWHLFDHLVQDYDSLLNNYGVIADHPERLDINFKTFINNNHGEPDWAHFNAIDYNAELDQILISSRSLNEIYIIDHSTTIFEAATSSGGRSGKGGDLLFRWGNPAVYDRGSPADQQLYGQHDAHWIQDSAPDAGKIMVFNNGENRLDGNYSSVDIIDAYPFPDGNYGLSGAATFAPDTAYFSFRGDGPSSFYSRRVSGALQLPNGNLLICVGNSYRIFEADSDGKILWDYYNPVTTSGPVAQGQMANNRDLFRAYKYGVDYPAFAGKDLTPGAKLERDPWDDDCTIFEEPTSIQETDFSDISISPNPTKGVLFVHGPDYARYNFMVYGINGQVLRQAQMESNSLIDLSDLESGIYIIQLFADMQEKPLVFKIIKTD